MNTKAKFAMAAVGTAALFSQAGAPTSVGTVPEHAIHRKTPARASYIQSGLDRIVVTVASVSTVQTVARPIVDDSFEWSDPFDMFVDPRPVAKAAGTVRQVDSFEALSELMHDVDGESWFE